MMSGSLPDVIGYPWDEAIEILEQAQFEVVEALITGPRQLGVLRRVVRQRLLNEKQVALVVAYFEPSKT